MSEVAEANIRLYNQPGMIAAYSGKRLMPQEEAIFKNIKPGRALDLGCGTGRATAALQKMGFTIIGLDISEAMISEARKLHPHGTFILGDASNLNGFNTESFDIVTFTCGGLDLLHPTSQRISCLREAHRVLKNGGVFIYSSHNKAYVDGHPEKNTPIDEGYYRNTGPVGTEVVYASHINEQAQQLKTVGLRMQRCYTGDILNYYVAEKAEPGGVVQVIKPPPHLLTLPARAIRKLKRTLSPPTRQTIVIDLTKPLNVLWGNVKKTRRAEITRGENIITVKVVKPSEAADYLTFEAERSQEINLFPLPPEWLREGHLFLAYDNESRLVAALLTHVRGKALVLRRDSALREEQHSHAALTWWAIRWAKAQGLREFDQGGYNEEKHPQVSFWKKRFGGTPRMRRAP